MINTLLPLLQLCDSSFPSGAFSHSFGLETYIQEEKITDKETFFQALSIYINKQLVFTDGLACRLAYELLESGGFSDLMELDQLLFVSSLANETRTGNRRIGTRMAKLCNDLYPSKNLNEYLTCINKKEAFGHSSIVFAMVSHLLRVDKDTCVTAFLFVTVSTMIQNGVRGIPLGQTDGQKLLVECQPLLTRAVSSISNLSIEDFGAVSPGLEIAQMKHESLHVRLFMS